MKKLFILITLLVSVITAFVLPKVAALMVHRTETYDNQLIAAQLSCNVEENVKENKIKESIKVRNTSNVDAYMRVRIVTYWTDSKGVAVGVPVSMPEFEVSGDWIVDTTNNTYYYKKPLEAEELSGEFLAENSVIELESDKKEWNHIEYEYFQVVEVVAEVIQAKPSNVVTESWGVTIDSNGNITGVN